MKLAFGTVFKWNAQTVGELTNISGIESTLDMIPATTHQSADYHKEVIPGLIDPGEVSIEGFLSETDANGQMAMLNDFNSRTKREAIIELPPSTGAKWTFNGYVTSIKIGDSPIDGGIPFSAKIKPTGKPVFSVATSAGMTALSISNSAVLTPVFNTNTLEYVATVLTGVSSVTFTPTAVSGVITVNDSVVATGQASSAITLGAAGSITPVVVKVTEANKAPKTYKFSVVRA